MGEAMPSSSFAGNRSWNQSHIQSLLECTICLEPSASPIYACKDNGHLVCGFCEEKLKKKGSICPVCKCKKLRPSPLGERQSRQNDMEGKCLFDGCSDKVLAAGMMAHVQNCEYREIQCSDAEIEGYGGPGPCNKMFALGEFPRHALDVHKMKLFWNSRNSSPYLQTYRLKTALIAGNEESEKFWGRAGLPLIHFKRLLCEYDGNYFSLHAAVGNYMFYWWITIYGGKKEANLYQYKTELQWPETEERNENARVADVQTRPVLPLHGNDEYDRFCGNYAMVHGAIATEYSTISLANTNERTLVLKFKMSRSAVKEGNKRTADSTDDESKNKRNKP